MNQRLLNLAHVVADFVFPGKSIKRHSRDSELAGCVRHVVLVSLYRNGYGVSLCGVSGLLQRDRRPFGRSLVVPEVCR